MTAPPRNGVNPSTPTGLSTEAYAILTSCVHQPLTRAVFPSIAPVVARFYAPDWLGMSMGFEVRAPERGASRMPVELRCCWYNSHECCNPLNTSVHMIGSTCPPAI